MAVINVKTGQPEDLDPMQVTQGLALGTHVPPPGQGVLLNPTGELVFVPGEDVPENIERYGYKIPNPDELLKLGRDFKYGADTMQLQAGLAGAARGGSFGASDFFAVKTGLTSPEHLSALKEYYPGTSLATEIGGAVATAPLSFTPSGAAVRAARLAEATAVGSAASLLPKSAMASAIARTAAETGGKALGGAIEGLAFGLGQSVSEAALGDPDLTAEKVIGHLGHSAILGGALGAGFNIGSVAVKKSLEKSKKVLQSAYENLIGKTVISPGAVGEQAGIPGFNVASLGDDIADDVSATLSKDIAEEQAQAAGQPVFEPGLLTKKLAKASSATSGVPEEEILEKFAAEMDPKRIVLTTAEKDAKVKVFGENLQQIYDAGKKLTKSLNKNVRPQEMRTLLADVSFEKPLMQLDDVAKGLNNAIKTMEKEPEIYSKGIVRKMSMLSERLEKNAGKYTNAFDVYEEIKTIRQKLDDLQQFDKAVIKNMSEADAINEFVSPLATQLRRGLEDKNIWGEAGARQAAFNQRLSSYLNWSKALEKEMMKKVQLGSGRPVFEVAPTKVNTMFNQVNDFRSKIPARASINFLKSFRELLEQAEESIKNAPGTKVDVTAIKDFTGKLSDEALQAKQYVSDAFGGYGFFRDLMDAAKSGGLGGMAAQIGTAFTNPDNLVRGLSKIEKWSKGTEKAMERAKVIFEKAKAPTKGAGVLWDNLTPSERTDQYKKYIQNLKQLSDVPDYLLDRLENATHDTFEAAPKTTQALQMALVRGTTFLLSKMPQPLDQALLDTPYEPSQAEMRTFSRYASIVENPTRAIDQLENNFVHKETLETLNQVYPKFYAALKTQIIEGLTDKVQGGKIDLPYQKRVFLSRFLDMPLDSSFRPELIGRNQLALNKLFGEKQAEEAQQAQARTTQAGLKEVSLSSRYQTGLEKVASRA